MAELLRKTWHGIGLTAKWTFVIGFSIVCVAIAGAHAWYPLVFDVR